MRALALDVSLAVIPPVLLLLLLLNAKCRVKCRTSRSFRVSSRERGM